MNCQVRKAGSDLHKIDSIERKTTSYNEGSAERQQF